MYLSIPSVSLKFSLTNPSSDYACWWMDTVVFLLASYAQIMDAFV